MPLRAMLMLLPCRLRRYAMPPRAIGFAADIAAAIFAAMPTCHAKMAYAHAAALRRFTSRRC